MNGDDTRLLMLILPAVGITPEYICGMRDSGYTSLTMAELINARDHGVGGTYARDMRQLGFAVPIDELVRARDHGVTAEFVRDMAALGYTNLTLDTLICIRDHGVTPDYAKALKALGYDRLAVEDLVRLRGHGLTAERIRAANDRAGTRLPIDLDVGAKPRVLPPAHFPHSLPPRHHQELATVNRVIRRLLATGRDAARARNCCIGPDNRQPFDVLALDAVAKNRGAFNGRTDE